jgi:uncharacterized membrane protein YoaK (UPF0700 family)
MMKDSERLRGSLHLLIGFFVGCVVAAAAVTYLRDWAWSFPAVLAAVAVALSYGEHSARGLLTDIDDRKRAEEKLHD